MHDEEHHSRHNIEERSHPLSEWLLPFRGRSLSGFQQQNFLWRSDRLYVMDNHRAALWCWWQHFFNVPTFQLLHIDRHFDTLKGIDGHLDLWLENLPPESCSLADYLTKTYGQAPIEMPVFRWDNYLSILLAKYPQRIDLAAFVTAREGDKPEFPEEKVKHLDPWEGLDLVERISVGDTRPHKSPWIVNIDIDFFTSRTFDGEEHFQMFDNDYLRQIGVALSRALASSHLLCATVALSPETTGGWDRAEELMRTLLQPHGEMPSIPP